MNEDTLSPAVPLPEPEREPVWGFAEVALFFGLAIPLFLLGAGLTYGLTALLAMKSSALRALIAQFGGYLAGLLPLWVVFGRKFGTGPMQTLRMSVPAGQSGASILAGVVASFGVLALSVLLRMPKLETPMEKLLEDPIMLAAAAVLGITLGPWVEELLFRGILQPVLVRATGFPGIVLSALPFALLHGPQYSWSWRHMVLLTLAGCAFGYWRYRTGSTGAATLMHAGYNMVLFAGFIAAKVAGADYLDPI